MLLLAFFALTNTCLAYDHIIFRNGQESDVKLYQINDEKITFGYIGDRTGTQQEVSSKDVYMIYIEKQGNIYITPEGKRITGETERADPKKNDVIYLKKGMEIGAENVKITENDVRYSIRSKSSGLAGLLSKGTTSEAVIDKSEVFMIRYKSGITDIINPMDTQKETEAKADTTVTENQEPQYTVIFHAVAKGENLKKIAAKYNVTTKQISEWNELPSRIKPTSPLTSGMQLMIYQPKQSK